MKEQTFNYDQALVEKSIPLLDIFQQNWKLPELKMLDIYLARINARDPNSRTVILQKRELENLLGVKQIQQSTLKNYLTKLFQSVNITNPTNNKMIQINLFSVAEAEKDEEDGLWKISLTCTEEAKRFFFNIENIGYIRFRLNSYLALDSLGGYMLMQYLLKNEYRIQWTESIKSLKNFLGFTDPYYEDFRRFNSKILKPACDEINEKMDIKFDYLPIRENRKTKYIQFHIKNRDQIPRATNILFEEKQKDFDKFWNAYPKKENKVEAEKAWAALNPSDELVDTILSRIDNWKKTERWKEENGRYIPQAGKWLQNKRWEDELPKLSSNTHKPSYDSEKYKRKAQNVPVYDPKKKK